MNYSALSSHYFTDWILVVTTLICLIVSWNHRDQKQLFFIHIYIVASLILDILASITEVIFYDKWPWQEINSVALNVYTLLEFTLIYLFILQSISRRKILFVIKILYTSYLLVVVGFWAISPGRLALNFPHLFALEGMIITIFCLLYFYEFIKSNSFEDIQKNSHFISISGILFYFSTTVPYYFSAFSLLQISPSFSNTYSCINYCLYTILFLTFIKAYLCSPHRD